MFAKLFQRTTCAALAYFCMTLGTMPQQNMPSVSDVEGAKIQQTPEFKAFIDQYIAAVNAKDTKALKALFDPVSQGAMAKEEQNVAIFFSRATEDKIPANSKLVVSSIGAKEPLIFENVGAVYAVRPTHLVQINYSVAENSDVSTVIFVSFSAGKWREVWMSPPDEKKLEAAEQQRADAERKAQAVEVSGVTDYKYEPNPPDIFTLVYSWEVRMTAEDSKKAQYEIVQVDEPDGGAGKAKVLVESSSVTENRDGFVGFKVRIGAKPESLRAMNGKIYEPIQFSGIGTGVGTSYGIQLLGTTLTAVESAGKGETLKNGSMRLARFKTTDANGANHVTDVVLRASAKSGGN